MRHVLFYVLRLLFTTKPARARARAQARTRTHGRTPLPRFRPPRRPLPPLPPVRHRRDRRDPLLVTLVALIGWGWLVDRLYRRTTEVLGRGLDQVGSQFISGIADTVRDVVQETVKAASAAYTAVWQAPTVAPADDQQHQQLHEQVDDPYTIAAEDFPDWTDLELPDDWPTDSNDRTTLIPPGADLISVIQAQAGGGAPMPGGTPDLAGELA